MVANFDWRAALLWGLSCTCTGGCGSALIPLPAHVGVGTTPRTRVLPVCAAGPATRERRVEAGCHPRPGQVESGFSGGFNAVAEPEGVWPPLYLAVSPCERR